MPGLSTRGTDPNKFPNGTFDGTGTNPTITGQLDVTGLVRAQSGATPGVQVLLQGGSTSLTAVSFLSSTEFGFGTGLRYSALGADNVIVADNVGLAVQIKATSGISIYRNINTAGVGVSAIYAAGVQTLNTNIAPTTLTYTPPATAGVYRLSGYLDVLTAGTMTFKVKITYTDPNGTARTDIPAFYLQNTTALLAGGPAANTTGQYVMFPYTLAINNGAVAITIQDNAGIYTAGTYYWTPVLEQLA